MNFIDFSKNNFHEKFFLSCSFFSNAVNILKMTYENN